MMKNGYVIITYLALIKKLKFFLLQLAEKWPEMDVKWLCFVLFISNKSLFQITTSKVVQKCAGTFLSRQKTLTLKSLQARGEVNSISILEDSGTPKF
jgi:hypothetical protein